MEFTPTAKRGFIKVRLVKGQLCRFAGKDLAVGYGEAKPLSRRKLILQMRKMISIAKQNKLESLSVQWKEIKSLAPKGMADFEVGKIACSAFDMANYEHNSYKTKPKDGFAEIKMVALVGITPEGIEGAKYGHRLAKEVNASRELSNTPGGDMTPKTLVAAAKTAVKGAKVKVTVLGRKEMQKIGMGAVLGMGKGSAEEPQFIVMEYWGAPKTQKPIVIIGKGVTFDTGGLNIKPGDHMYEMHMDMSGGAAVIHAFAFAAKQQIKTNIIALIPAVENSVSGSSVRPGDILKSLSGKTIEILNTDAEGRVIVADAITYAKRYNPDMVIDAASLTGAALTALGTQASALMTNNQELEDLLRTLGEESGDYVWPFPMWEEYDVMVKGKFADVPNISTDGNSRYGGVIAGGKFLEVFAKELNCAWAHLDTSPCMTSNPNEFLAKGAAGAPVRLLVAAIEHHANR